MKCVIDRAEWNSGFRLSSHARLLADREYHIHEDGAARCCLGFLGRACGLPDEHLRKRAMPSEVIGAWPAALFDNTEHVERFDDVFGAEPEVVQWERVFAALNDHKDIDDATRESWIAAGFQIVLGVEVEFVGEYPTAEASP